MSVGSSQNVGGYLVVEIAGELISQLVRIYEMMCEGCPKDQATGKSSQGEVLYTQTRPLHPHPTPSLLLFTAGKENKKKEKEELVQRRFMEKCLKGEKEKERQSHKIWNNSIGIFHVYAL